jgi:DNA-binding transcriptional LysR family regulator
VSNEFVLWFCKIAERVADRQELDVAAVLDWNDLKYFLAVAREGSTLAAARRLRTSQTTVARRIAALEQALGIRLFEKRQAGYSLTPGGQELLGQAGKVESAADAFAESASAHTRDLTGTVRITSEEIYALSLISPLLRDLHEKHPEIIVELDTNSAIRDLGAGEADIALRSSAAEQPSGLVGRRLCVDDWTLYCSRDYAERHGRPTSVKELKKHAIVGGGGAKLWEHYQKWLRDLDLEDRVAMHHATSTGLLTAIRSGFGVSVLPCVVGDADPDLIRCLPPKDGHGRVLWLFTHERVRHEPRVRAVIDLLYEGLSRHVRQLEDKAAAA